MPAQMKYRTKHIRELIDNEPLTVVIERLQELVKEYPNAVLDIRSEGYYDGATCDIAYQSLETREELEHREWREDYDRKQREEALKAKAAKKAYQEELEALNRKYANVPRK